MAGQAIVDRELTLDDFDFPLPAELIAQEPLAERGASRLLHVTQDALHDRAFADLERLLIPGDLLVFNDTRVIKARLFGRKPSGGRVEVLVERVLEPNLALALARTSHRPNIGTHFIFGDDVLAIIEGRRDDFLLLRFSDDVHAVLHRHGHVPLPPYITHADSAIDAERYQTVYATQPGAVAAPTAGLHFTSALLERLRARGVQTAHITLHVGAGTFQPVRAQRLTDHRMHSEWYSVPTETASAVDDARRDGRNVVAVGTTSLRALESAASEKSRIWPGSRETALFITPGFSFRIVDRLITNFHLPRSTLLMLVSAFAGVERIREAYSHAIERRYRFFSYGDAMLLERAR